MSFNRLKYVPEVKRKKYNACMRLITVYIELLSTLLSEILSEIHGIYAVKFIFTCYW